MPCKVEEMREDEIVREISAEEMQESMEADGINNVREQGFMRGYEEDAERSFAETA